MVVKRIQAMLLDRQDTAYRDFSASLLPTVDPQTVIGVRMPVLRCLAKEWGKDSAVAEFLDALPHVYLEENHLHALLIAQMRDFDACIAALDRFLPYIDNWATCDSLRPACFKYNRTVLLPHIERWLTSTHPYTVRFAMEMLMTWYLDDAFEEQYLEWVVSVTDDHYYVRMMVAWYVATALVKQYDTSVAVLEQHRLPLWTHNKAIQKAIESYRITDAKKAYLRTLKRKDEGR